MEDEIPKKSLLTLKEVQGPHFERGNNPVFFVAYKHYVLFFGFFDSDQNDCVVFDTQKETLTMTTTGLQLRPIKEYSLCYWKENILVLYLQRTEAPTGGLFGPPKFRELYLLHVLEDPSPPGISFKVEIINSLDMREPQCPHGLHPIQIYKDDAYVLVEGAKEGMEVWKYDLNQQHAWNKCQVTGQIPKARQSPCSIIFRNKLHLFGGNRKSQSLIDQGGPMNDLHVLDLETMKWDGFCQTNFLPTRMLTTLQADIIGQNIYIYSQDSAEFLVYNPNSLTVQKSETATPIKGFRIKSFDGRTTLFRFAASFGKGKRIAYQIFNLDNSKTEQAQKTESRGLTETFSSPLSHMERIWKEKSFADITFIVQGEEIPVHRVILVKCRYFQNMFQSGMIEANSDKINVPDISSTNFKAILEYIYCDKIALTEPLALDLIILADMYFLTKLKSDCEGYLSTHLTIQNLLNVVKAAETADSEKLNERVVSFLIANIDKVKQEIDIHAIPPELFIKAISNLKQSKK